jgi:hypothetical protein
MAEGKYKYPMEEEARADERETLLSAVQTPLQYQIHAPHEVIPPSGEDPIAVVVPRMVVAIPGRVPGTWDYVNPKQARRICILRARKTRNFLKQ